MQFTLYVSDDAAPTLVDHTAERLTTLKACRNLGLTKEEAAHLQSSSTLANYGDLCLPKHKLEERMKPATTNPLRAGGLLGCKGGVVHAGPRSTGVRVALFFVGRLKTNASYDSDSQHTAWTMPFLLADEAKAANDVDLYKKLRKRGRFGAWD